MITAQIESLTHGLEEIKPLLPIHYKELSLHQFHGHPLDPQYDVYLKRDSLGEIIYCTIREDGALVGYYVGFLAPGLHYKGCFTLIGDIFYVLPEHRSKGSGWLLFEEVKNEAKRRGARAWFTGEKEHLKKMLPTEKLFRAIGMEPAETMWCLWLGD